LDDANWELYYTMKRLDTRSSYLFKTFEEVGILAKRIRRNENAYSSDWQTKINMVDYFTGYSARFHTNSLWHELEFWVGFDLNRDYPCANCHQHRKF